MQIAVFGGTGRTGRHVVTQALAAEHEVRVLVRSEDSARRLGRHDRLTAVVGTFEMTTSPRSRACGPHSRPTAPWPGTRSNSLAGFAYGTDVSRCRR